MQHLTVNPWTVGHLEWPPRPGVFFSVPAADARQIKVGDLVEVQNGNSMVVMEVYSVWPDVNRVTVAVP